MILLDIRYNPKTKKIIKWIKENLKNIMKNGIRPGVGKGWCKLGNMALRFFDKVPGVIELHFEEKSTALGRIPEKVICATVDPNFLYDITSICNHHKYDVYILL